MKKLNPIIHYSLVLFTIMATVALVLAGANKMTNGVISKRQQDEQTEARTKVVGGVEYNIEAALQSENATVWKYILEGQPVAYAAVAKATGYGGDINVMVGMGADFSVLGIDIISMSETPGLGSKIEEDSFKQQFFGKIVPISAVKSEEANTSNEISAISGATVSSRAVTEAVNRAVENTKNLVGETNGQ